MRDCPPVRKLAYESNIASDSDQKDSAQVATLSKFSTSKLGAIKNVDFDISLLHLRGASQAIDIERSSSSCSMASEDELDDVFTDDIFADDDSDWREDQEKNDNSIASHSGISLYECISEMHQLQQLMLKEAEAEAEALRLDENCYSALMSKLDEVTELDKNNHHLVRPLDDTAIALLISRWLDSGAQVSRSRRLLRILSEEIVTQERKISRRIKSIRYMWWLLDPVKHTLVAFVALKGRESVEEQGRREEDRYVILGALLVRLQRDHEQGSQYDPQQTLQQRMIEDSFAKFGQSYQNRMKPEQANSSLVQRMNLWNPDSMRFSSLLVMFAPHRDSCAISIEALMSIGSYITDTREPNTREKRASDKTIAIIDLMLVISGNDCLVDLPGVHVLPNSSLRSLYTSSVPDMVICGAVPGLQRLQTGHVIHHEMLFFHKTTFWTFFPV